MHCLPAHRGEEVTDARVRRAAIGRVRRSGKPVALAKERAGLGVDVTAPDFVRSFQIEGMNVRGRIVHLTDRRRSRDRGACLSRRVSRVVGEALALVALLGRVAEIRGHADAADAQQRAVAHDRCRFHVARTRCARARRSIARRSRRWGRCRCSRIWWARDRLRSRSIQAATWSAIKASCRLKARGLPTGRRAISTTPNRFRRASNSALRR